MHEPARRDVAEVLADRHLIEAALTKGVRQALTKHIQAGESVAIWEGGKVVWIPAAEALARLDGRENGLN
jgi:hypothetical protein